MTLVRFMGNSQGTGRAPATAPTGGRYDVAMAAQAAEDLVDFLVMRKVTVDVIVKARARRPRQGVDRVRRLSRHPGRGGRARQAEVGPEPKFDAPSPLLMMDAPRVAKIVLPAMRLSARGCSPFGSERKMQS